MINDKKISPFTPGNPVSYELFVGREDKLKEIIRYIEQSLAGKQENVFLSGDRGIGKSSLASFLRRFVKTKLNMLTIHTFLGGVLTLEEMVRHLFEELLKESKDHPSLGDIVQLFAKHVKEIGLFGISISFNPPQQELGDLVRNFPEAISNILAKMEGQKKGLFIVLDDINGIVEKETFANWYKSFVDKVATHWQSFPVFLMLIGLPEKRDIMAKFQPSLTRIFRIVNIEKLNNSEVKKFLDMAFKGANIKVENDAMDLMSYYSCGLPLFMHEIGDAAFYHDNDGVINEDDAVKGILKAAQIIGEKYLDPKVYRAIRSERYRSILRKLGELGDETSKVNFNKKEIAEKLSIPERKVFDNFLRKMRELGVIESDMERGRGSYKYVNEMYPIYISMESARAKEKGKS